MESEPEDITVNPETGTDRFIENVASGASTIAYVGTVGALFIGFPVTGACLLGAFGAAAGVTGIVGGAVAGLVAGFAPAAFIQSRSSSTDFGMLETLGVVAVKTDKGVKSILSPLKSISEYFREAAKPNFEEKNEQDHNPPPPPPMM